MTSRTDLAWLAGIVDGEGSIGAYRGKDDCVRLHLTIANTDRRIIEKAALLLPGAVVKLRGRPTNLTRRQLATIVVLKQEDMQAALQLLLPFLVGKHEEAKAVLAYLKTRFGMSHRGQHYSGLRPELRQLQEALLEQLRQTKHPAFKGFIVAGN